MNRSKPSSISSSSLFLIGGILGAMIIGGILAFLFLYFKITQINIQREEGDSNIRYAQMIQMFEYAKGYNILILSTEFLEESFLNRFPELESIEIDKQIPNTLNITTVPESPKVRWVYTHAPSGQQLFGYISSKNLFLPEGDEALFTFFDTQPRNQKIEFYTELTDGIHTNEILDAKTEIETLLSRKIVSAKYLRDAQEIHLIDENNIAYWLFLGEDISTQILKLKLGVKSNPSLLSKTSEYIDLRIGESLIYK